MNEIFRSIENTATSLCLALNCICLVVVLKVDVETTYPGQVSHYLKDTTSRTVILSILVIKHLVLEDLIHCRLILSVKNNRLELIDDIPNILL